MFNEGRQTKLSLLTRHHECLELHINGSKGGAITVYFACKIKPADDRSTKICPGAAKNVPETFGEFKPDGFCSF